MLNLINSYVKHFLGAVWSVFCISTSLVFMILFFSRSLPLWFARNMWAPGILFIYGVKLKVEGKMNIKKGIPYIVVANHSSFLDIPVAFMSLPFNIYFVAKKELKKVPFLGWYMMATGMIFIDRTNRAEAIKSLQKAGKLINGGKSVLTFPEGTRSKTGEITEFKKGTFHLAQSAKVEILPLRIKNAHKVLDANSARTKAGRIEAVIGKPINTNNLNSQNIDSFMSEVRNIICEM